MFRLGDYGTLCREGESGEDELTACSPLPPPQIEEIIQGPFGLCISRSVDGEKKLDNIAYQSLRVVGMYEDFRTSG